LVAYSFFGMCLVGMGVFPLSPFQSEFEIKR
jgi:hypothetical protein